MKKKLLLASVVLCSSLITSCGGNNNTSSPSQSTSSSDVQTSTTTSTSSTSNSSQGGTSSSSSSSSTTEPAPSAKTFRIDPSNFNSISALTLSGVVENTQYNDEFTVNAGGSITSTAFKGITKSLQNVIPHTKTWKCIVAHRQAEQKLILSKKLVQIALHTHTISLLQAIHSTLSIIKQK